jgi:hypothetical protein
MKHYYFGLWGNECEHPHILDFCISWIEWPVRFEVFTAVTMKNGVFWDVTPCGCLENRRFGGTYRLYYQDDKSQ